MASKKTNTTDNPRGHIASSSAAPGQLSPDQNPTSSGPQSVSVTVTDEHRLKDPFEAQAAIIGAQQVISSLETELEATPKSNRDRGKIVKSISNKKAMQARREGKHEAVLRELGFEKFPEDNDERLKLKAKWLENVFSIWIKQTKNRAGADTPRSLTNFNMNRRTHYFSNENKWLQGYISDIESAQELSDEFKALVENVMSLQQNYKTRIGVGEPAGGNAKGKKHTSTEELQMLVNDPGASYASKKPKKKGKVSPVDATQSPGASHPSTSTKEPK